MSYYSIIDYLRVLSKSYFLMKKEEKTMALNHATKVTGLHRKTVIRKLSYRENIKNNKKGSCGRKPRYPKELLLPHVKKLWVQMERITAPRMKAGLKDWLPFYDVDTHIKYLLEKMSASTLARFIREVKVIYEEENKGLTSTSPARYMKNKVPINTLDHTVDRAGYMQADTVAHCGNSLNGAFINSITVTDIFSTWTENRAMYTKKADKVRKALTDIKINLPFNLIAINTDSGSEFLNTPVYNYFTGLNIKFTRSRPYKKNDNCFVEQKNFTHTRELFGYQRFEQIELETLMNEIYIYYWNPLQNFFLPTFKLIKKVRIGARIKKTYDVPKTPYQRLIDSNFVTTKQKEELKKRREPLNPFELKKNLEIKLDAFFKKVNQYNMEKKNENI